MQIRQSTAGVGGSRIITEPKGPQPWDFVNSNQDEVLALLKPGGDRTTTIFMVAGALLVGLGLGWTCATNTAVFNIAPTETPRKLAEIKPGNKSDGARRTSSVSPVPPAKADGTSPASIRLSGDAAGSPVASLANTASPARDLVAVPETRPTTIAGWTVLEVRGGTVVLEGPEGVRTAAPGDSVPGIGRVDS